MKGAYSDVLNCVVERERCSNALVSAPGVSENMDRLGDSEGLEKAIGSEIATSSATGGECARSRCAAQSTHMIETMNAALRRSKLRHSEPLS